ncbi:MAG: histidinol-phosphate transaminase [Myxococcota bacterium]
MQHLIPPHIQRMVPYVAGKTTAELQREYGIEHPIKLASNESPFGMSPQARTALTEASDDLHRYPDPNAYDLRHSLAKHYEVLPEEVAVGNGSNELLDIACRTFASSEHHAVFGTPSFVCYRLGCIAANVPYTEVPLREHLYWNVDDLLQAVRPDTSLMFVANPNNPTGTHMPEAALRTLVTELPPHVLLVVDEAYVEFADAPDFVSALNLRHLRKRLAVTRTFSKAHGLAALRVGYLIGTPDAVELINRVRAPFSCNMLGQIAARASLRDADHLNRYLAMNAAQREALTRGLEQMGLRVARSQTNFVLVQVGSSGRDVYERLLRSGIIVRPMSPPIEEWIRISVGLPGENESLLATLPQVL